MDGVYLPYWAFDAAGHVAYRGERGEYYYETVRYTENGEDKTREERRTRWYNASGAIDVAYDDVLVCGSPSLPEKLIEKLEPWDLPSLATFDGRFLAGFAAERYRVDAKAGFETAKERVDPDIRKQIRRDIGGDEQRIHDVNTDWNAVGFRHVLLPLWLSAFRYRDRVFHVTINARTSEIAGERPYSAAKIALFVLAIAALIAGIAYAIYRARQH